MNIRKYETQLGRHSLVIETGRMAKQADGAVTVRYGDTIVLVTVCVADQPKEGQDFFPLSCEYQERTYAGGKIPGGYFKREGRLTERETLSSRLIDRPIRPLFPEGFLNEVQVVATVISSDKEHNADVLAITGASAALMLSGAPYLGPVAAVRVGELNGQLVINPTFQELETSTLDLVAAVTERGVIMIEAGAGIVPESRVVEALQFATEALAPVLKLQRQLQSECGKTGRTFEIKELPAELCEQVRKRCVADLDSIARNQKTKESRDEAIGRLRDRLVSELVVEGGSVTEDEVDAVFHEIEKDEVRRFITENGLRPDGRKTDEIRPITCEVGVLPRAHGSALFTRGQTQSLGTTTLGTTKDEQLIDALEGNSYKTFMLHYNFPPYSVGEIKPMRGPGRREIGHGALAERSLRAVIPSKEEFPYVIRLVSDILESNGSSSMASVCSGSLSMMDAGVPIKGPVSGIAMGLVKYKDTFTILSDIAGVEDHLGDMDFKVAGTAQGITAIQLDLKLKESIDVATLQRALEQARRGRLHILEKMSAALTTPRPSLSPYAPRITTIRIDQEKIRELIGPGGKMIRKITADSGAQIDVEDDGTVSIASSDEACTKKALEMIRGITEDPEVGQIYKATVKRIMSFGAFCEISPGKEGLLHVSELSEEYVESVESALKVGDQLDVKVIEIDAQGRINLSKKQLNSTGAPVGLKRGSGPKRGENGKNPHQKKSWR